MNSKNILFFTVLLCCASAVHGMDAFVDSQAAHELVLANNSSWRVTIQDVADGKQARAMLTRYGIHHIVAVTYQGRAYKEEAYQLYDTSDYGWPSRVYVPWPDEEVVAMLKRELCKRR